MSLVKAKSMSPDDIDRLTVEVIEWLEEEGCCINFDNDSIHEEFVKIFYDRLESFCSRDRNYN